MSLAGENRNYAIVRQGAVARISEYLDGKTKSFLIDSFVFPGNSGGPVILKPEINSIQGTKSNSKAMLVGVVEGYQPYIDIASSLQTKHQRIAFEENSGLAVIFPMDCVNEMLKEKSEAILKAEQSEVEASRDSARPRSCSGQVRAAICPASERPFADSLIIRRRRSIGKWVVLPENSRNMIGVKFLVPWSNFRQSSPPQKKLASRELDASVEASGPHDFAVRRSTLRPRKMFAPRRPRPSHPLPYVRDDRETPLCAGRGRRWM